MEERIDSGLESCKNLLELCLVEFDEQDFSAISKLSSVRELKVKTSSVKSTLGLEGCESLESLLLGNCRKLASIKHIGGHVALRTLHIDGSKKISDFDVLDNLSSLEVLILIDCGEVPSLKFLNKFPSLREIRIFGRTKILDDDLSALERIETVVLP